jgi:hypothetical protein
VTRNTHDRIYDHHGTDTDDHILLSASTSSYANAENLHTVLADIDARLIAGGGGIGITDLITGDSSVFASSTGSWTNSGGTLSHDTTAAYNLFTGNLMFATASGGDRVDLLIPGTFEAGIQYDVMVAVLVEQSGATWLDYSFGLLGTDYASNISSFLYVENPHLYSHSVLTWTPSATRTGVSVRVARNASTTGTKTIHIGWALCRAAGGSSALGLRMIEAANTAQGYGLTVESIGGWTQIQAKYDKANTQTAALQFNHSGNALYLTGYDYGSSGNVPYVGVNGTGDVYIYAGGATASGDRTAHGVNIEVGPDYVGLYIDEKDASTVQIYPDNDYDVELAEWAGSTTHHWKARAQDDGVAIMALGMLPQYTSAPSSPTEGQSYYDLTLHKSRTWDGSAWQNHW